MEQVLQKSKGLEEKEVEGMNYFALLILCLTLYLLALNGIEDESF